MGQYYTPLIKQDGQSFAYDTGVSHKLTGQANIGGAPDRIASILYKNPVEFAWVGDYADENEWEKGYYDLAHGKGIEELPLKEVSSIDITDKYIVNHSKFEYVNMKSYMAKVQNDEWGPTHPLPLLTAIGNGRGGGDYYSPVHAEDVGRWAGDIISIEDYAPQDFKELDVYFSEDDRIIEEWKEKHTLIDRIIEASLAIADFGEDILVIPNFGDYNVKIRISKDNDANEQETPFFEIEVSAPQPKGKLFGENKLVLGTVQDLYIEDDEFKKALQGISDGSLKITTDSVRSETKTVKEALKSFNEKIQGKGMER